MADVWAALDRVVKNKDAEMTPLELKLANLKVLRKSTHSKVVLSQLKKKLTLRRLTEQGISHTLETHIEHELGVSAAGKMILGCGVKWTYRKFLQLRELLNSEHNLCITTSQDSYVLGCLLKQHTQGINTEERRGKCITPHHC